MPRKKQLLDEKLTGSFGKLTIINFSHKSENDCYFNCLCECGTQVIKSQRYLLGKRNKHSCGCQSPCAFTGKKNINWRGCGDLSLNLFNRYKITANKRGFEFDISIEYVWDLFLKQDKKCALTGLPLIFNLTFKTQPDRTASLDRIDSNKGYIEGNVQWVHKFINYFKKNIPNELLIGICHLVAQNKNLLISNADLKMGIETHKYLWNSKGKDQS